MQILVDFLPNQLTTRFREPLSYVPNELVKLSPTIGNGFRWIVVAPEASTNVLKIFGVCDPVLSPIHDANCNRWARVCHVGTHEFRGLRLSVLGPGRLRLSTVSADFELRGGNIILPYSLWLIDYISDWYQEAATLMGIDRHVGTNLIRRTLSKILSQTCEARHGGCFLMSARGFRRPKPKPKIQVSFGFNTAARSTSRANDG